MSPSLPSAVPVEPPPSYNSDARPDSWVVLEREGSDSGDWEYEYLPLVGADTIRILVLDPAQDFDDDLKGELEHIPLSSINDGNGYIALSYDCWEGIEDQEEIYIGTGKAEEYPIMALRPNLASAFRHLRRNDRSIRLWAGAVCINQADLTEQNNQVHQMHAVFSSARETVIFLGSQGGNVSRSAWNFLERNSKWAMDETGERNFELPAVREEEIDFRGDLSDVEIDVLTRGWFRSVWIFQEVVVSKNVSVQCGRRRVGWDDFCKILLLSPRYHDRYGYSMRWDDKLETVRDLFHARCTYQERHGLENLRPPWQSSVDNYKGKSSDILHNLQIGRRLRGLDFRDKIYAMVEISSGVDSSNALVAVDYNKPCLEVCADYARYILETSNSYDLLSYIYELDFGNPELPLIVFPSWVPDWHSPSGNITRTMLSTLDPETDEDTLLRQLLVKHSRVWLDSRTLVITEGYVIGEVSDYGPEVLLQGQDERAFQDLRDKYEGDQDTLYEEIMNLWMHGFCQRSAIEEATGVAPRRGQRRDFLQGKASNFSRLIDLSPNVPKASVEHHMFTRARKTATWKDDGYKAVDWVIDKSSILDGKRIGLCSTATKPLTSVINSVEDRLIILPPGAKFGDLVVYFRGARVPFIVRRTESPSPLEQETRRTQAKEKLKDLGVDCSVELEHCKIIGEALVNGFGELARDEVEMNSVKKWSPLKKSFQEGPKTMFVLSEKQIPTIWSSEFSS
ncbi:hypothetical protein L207DRAFT_508342 [Hyaloscypha variabilis F]|uniref:Heterokaryon incompatibility domain-containing protein n=1 Tax=Hyaloscypha variabilis (strain UAMH 11265 / GT02V1 / F) TaxID=1149755 RepID=A0A2J6S3X3_HYAVF|nr:hypothetical protein L207DRAFT_508342 [Hyaloscypha variabilis F]